MFLPLLVWISAASCNATRCVEEWLADGMCDADCDNAECDFDAGDCGRPTTTTTTTLRPLRPSAPLALRAAARMGNATIVRGRLGGATLGASRARCAQGAAFPVLHFVVRLVARRLELRDLPRRSKASSVRAWT